jgi:hypothetical protein
MSSGTCNPNPRQPSARRPSVRWLYKRAATRLGREDGTMMGFDALVLAAIGRESGPGAAGNPAHCSIATHPCEVRVERDGHTVAVIAGQLHGVLRGEAWRQITAAGARLARCQQETGHKRPVIRPTPRGG